MGTQAFEVIVKQQIKRLEDPGLKCCQLVYDELIRILGQLLQKIVRLFILSMRWKQFADARHSFNSKCSDATQHLRNASIL